MIIKIYPDNPNPKEVRKVTEILQDGGVIIYPTDTVYGLGCDITKHRAAEKVARIKGKDLKKADFSFVFNDLSQVSYYTKQIDNRTFKLLKRNLPGPFTFILNANTNIPKYFREKKKTVGIRIPDNSITIELIKTLGNPLISTSVHEQDGIIEYTTDPELIHEKYKNQVDAVIDGGFGKNMPSTVVDCTSGDPEIIRQGVGEMTY